MLIMIRTYSFRVKDSNSGKVLKKLSESVNLVWNFCNESQRHAVKWNLRFPTGFDLNKLTAGVGKALGLHSQTVQAVCEEYATRRKQCKKKKLRWRGKRSLGWIPFKKAGIKVANGSIQYAGNAFRFWKSREIDGDIKCGSFSQDARGRWYVNITCEVPEEQPTQGKKQIGIDLGLKTLGACSDGSKIEAPKWYRRIQEKIGRYQRKKHNRRVKNLHAKIKNQRKDFLHKVTDRLTKECELLVVGNLSSSKLAKTNMAKSVLDISLSMFRNFLEYKAMARKVVYREVDERFSTQACSECGSISGPKGREGLGVREWVCRACGTHHDRDTNAALNILRLGCQALASEVS